MQLETQMSLERAALGQPEEEWPMINGTNQARGSSERLSQLNSAQLSSAQLGSKISINF